MGVFARFLRRSQENPAEETTGGHQTEAPEDAPAAEAVEAEGAAATDQAGAPAEAAEGVEIPRQQSAGEAADSGAGEGARK
ncbi:hypothetical protein ACWF94_23700 [Streptomyces sp. NPDC055078]